MADEKISHLVSTKPAGPLTVADGFEVSQTLSTVPATKGAVFSQLVTLLQTAFPSLSWASGVSNLQPNGDIFVGAGNLAIINAADGSATFGATKIQMNSDGSGSFATATFSIGADGGLTMSGTGGIDMFGGKHQILASGAVNFNNSIVAIDATDGSLTVDNGAGAVFLDSNDGSVTAVSYKVGANQVVGAQQGAIADCDINDVTDVGGKLNSLLGAMRAHGLIDT